MKASIFVSIKNRQSLEIIGEIISPEFQGMPIHLSNIEINPKKVEGLDMSEKLDIPSVLALIAATGSDAFMNQEYPAYSDLKLEGLMSEFDGLLLKVEISNPLLVEVGAIHHKVVYSSLEFISAKSWKKPPVMAESRKTLLAKSRAWS